MAKERSWKEVLLGAGYEKLIDLRAPKVTYSNHLEIPISFSDRFHIIEQGEAAALYGSTFATNKQERISDAPHHLLDGAYCGSCFKNTDGSGTGFAFAMGDGAGGHFGDPLQDRHIADSAYFCSKSFVRFSSAYTSVDSFKKDAFPLISSMKAVVDRKGKGEGTTFVGGRAFPELGGFRLFAFGIGDSMMFGWDPAAKQFYSLLNSTVTEAGTAIFPVNYRPKDELNIREMFVPKGTLVFLLTDGLHDLLDYKESEGQYSNKLTYRSRVLLNIDQLFGPISKDAPAAEYLRILGEAATQKIETDRKRCSEQRVQMGDDVMAIACPLSGGQEGVIANLATLIKTSRFF